MSRHNDQLAMYTAWQFPGPVMALSAFQDKVYKLVPRADDKVDDRETAVVSVTRKGFPDITLYYDRETGLLAKSSTRVKAADQGFKEVVQEVWYKDYKESEGVKFPSKLVIKRDGKEFVESEVSELRLEDVREVRNELFGKP